jgi:hypothetical protein
VCCQVEVSATDRSFVQKSPSECSLSVCDVETSTVKRPRTDKGSSAKVKNIYSIPAAGILTPCCML